MAFDEFRLLDNAFQLADRRVIALQMADLKNNISHSRGFHQIPPFGDIRRQRFLNQHINAPFEKFPRDVTVKPGGHGDTHALDPPEQLAIIMYRFGMTLASDLSSSDLINIDHRDELGLVGCRVLPGIKFTEISTPHDTHTNLGIGRHKTAIRCPLPPQRFLTVPPLAAPPLSPKE